MASDQSDASQFVSMNMAGRFAGREIRCFGQQVIKHILTEKDIGLFFGQQTNFRPSLPRHFEFVGNTRAFIVFNRRQFKMCDEKQYRHYIRELEMQGSLPRHYLPETNFVIVKVKTRSFNVPKSEFIAVSWFTDECMSKVKASSNVKKLLAFVENLSNLEQLPVIVGGTFRLPPKDMKSLMTENFRCCGYLPSSKRREVRAASAYVISRSLWMTDVKPIVCSKIEVGESEMDKWMNPEDAFYWDPAIATFIRTSEPSISRAASPQLVERVPTPPAPPAQVVIVPQADVNCNYTNGGDTIAMTNGDTTIVAVADEANDDIMDVVDGEIRRIPSYVELYDEEMMESNAVCYMQ